jgi:hypothetical protein
MKKLKNLILKISAKKAKFFLNSFDITVLISFIYIIFASIVFNEKSSANFYLYSGLIIIYGVFVVLTVTLWLIIKLKVTGFPDKKNRIIFLHAPGGGEIYKSPQWKKIPYSIINFPNNWKEIIAAGKQKDANFFIETTANRNDVLFIVYLPITIKFYFNGPLNISDLENLMLDGNNKNLKRRVINFEEYIKETFFSLNSGDEQSEKIYAAAKDWLSGKGSQVYLSKTAERVITFPDKLFSNVEKTEIKIGLADSRIHPIMEINPYQTMIAQTNQY